MNATNVAYELLLHAESQPDQIAVASPISSHRHGTHRRYRQISFGQLAVRTNAIAHGLRDMGMQPGHRIALLVPYGEDFIALVLALLRVGVTQVLIDPGMGRKHLLNCLEESKLDGFIGITKAQIIRRLLQHRFPNAKLNVTVGSRLGLLSGPTLTEIERAGAKHHDAEVMMSPRSLQDEAAIIFTTGSTGPPKGVLYTHGTFRCQIDQLVNHYHIQPGSRDLSGFPLFGLFNAVMGTSTIIPDMDPTRPASVDPPRLLDAIDQWAINQSFGSPALWTRVGRHCQRTGRRIPSLERIFSAGAPVPPWVLEWMRRAMPDHGQIFTPYGATEALPIASIESREILNETAAMSRLGAGTCVGHRFPAVSWKIIAIDDGPLNSLADTRELEPGQIGELLVSGPMVTKEYVTRLDQNALHKVHDGEHIWHRMGDVGYLDPSDRFWYCGRKSHRVRLANQTLFTEPCEAIVNNHDHVYRSALVGVGSTQPTDEGKRPVLVVEPWPEHRPATMTEQNRLIEELYLRCQDSDVTRDIQDIMIYPSKLPTDIRHNSKIFREQLGPWAEQQLKHHRTESH